MIKIERPGVSIDIKSAPTRNELKDGIVAIVLPLDMSTGGTNCVTLTQSTDLASEFTLGGKVNLKYLNLIKYMLKYCNQVKIFPTGEETQASLTVDANVTIYANKNGVYGNDLKLEVVTDTSNLGYFKAYITYRGERLERFEMLKRWSELGNATDLLNITYKTSTDLVEGNYQLTGGVSPNLTVGAYTTALAKLQAEEFNVFVTPLSISGDGDVWSTVELATDMAIKDIREQDEKLRRYIVTSETSSGVAKTNLPFKYVLNVTGLNYSDGSRFRDYEAKAILGAIIAGTDANVSLTNLQVTGATGVYNVRSNRQIEQDLQNGYIMFYVDGNGAVRIVKDQTSFVNEDGVTPLSYTSGLCIREVDYIVNAIKENFEAEFLGKVKVTEDNAKLYRDVVFSLLNDFQTEGYITNVQVDDVEVAISGRNGFLLGLRLQPTDSLEKLSIEVEVR